MDLYLAGVLSRPYVIGGGYDGYIPCRWNFRESLSDMETNSRWGWYNESLPGRVVDYHAARLQVQERLVADIVEDITKALGTEYPPLGVALMMQGEHLCKTMRGVKKPGLMSACRLDGIFREETAARAEFLATANKLLS